MKNTELRIGNIVKRNGLIVTVDEQTFWDMKNNPDQYKPVPLTEEWLLRLGFEKKQPNYTWYRKNRVTINVFNDVAFRLNTNGYCVYKPFKHVHQLQNLYFALTGEELTTKN
jgi:hypothetical protein